MARTFASIVAMRLSTTEQTAMDRIMVNVRAIGSCMDDALDPKFDQVWHTFFIEISCSLLDGGSDDHSSLRKHKMIQNY